MSPSISIIVRSILFNVLFYANLIGFFVFSLPSLLLPRRYARACIRACALVTLWLLRTVCGIGAEFRGIGKLPKTACIVACKHQSAWETFGLFAVLDAPVFILKRELMWVPFFGWYAWKAGYIAVDRSAGLAALTRMTARAKSALADGYQLVIFPEGTRRPPGAELRITSPASLIFTARRACPAFPSRSIRACIGRGDRCCVHPARSFSKYWIRSRRASTEQPS